MGTVYGICGDTKCRREVIPKIQVENFTSNITVKDNTIYRASEDIVENFAVSIPGCNDNDVLNCELQFKTGADVTKIGIFHPFNDINVTGLDFLETSTEIDWYTVDSGAIYDVLIWYAGQRVNVAVI